ncbi:MAG: hypothetical protein OXC91_05270 [Rhodobacteraceae bacterium]|nr:hypothetical protein [Paracoccaceae bacterium]
MRDERDNALAIAALRGELKVQEERMETMKSDLPASLERNNAAFERLHADMATRETRLILAMIVSVSLTIFGFLTTP